MIWTNEAIKKLIQLINENKTVDEISSIFEISNQAIRTRVFKIVKEDENMLFLKEKFNQINNLKKRQNKSKIWTKEEDELLIKLREEDISYETISKEYIITNIAQIQLRARELGIIKKNKRPWTEKESKLAEDMYLEGKTLEDIDIILNRGVGAIEQRLKRNGVLITKSKRSWSDSDDKVLLFLYSSGKQYKEISEIMNKKESFIKSRLKEIGIIIDNNGLCKRCNESQAIGSGEYEGLCEECINDKKIKEKALKKAKQQENLDKKTINEYIERNKETLKYCDKCGEEKDIYEDYYYSINKSKTGISINRECKKCFRKRDKIKKINSLKNKGYK